MMIYRGTCLVVAVVVWIGLVAGSASDTFAEKIIQPTFVATSFTTFFNASTADHTSDQSGLSAGYASGIDDFDVYIASNPRHNSVLGTNVLLTGNSEVVGSVDYSLGGPKRIESLALWNTGQNATFNVIQFSVEVADNAAFTGATNVGTFNANPNTANFAVVLPEVFTFAPTVGSFVRFNVLTNNGTTGTLGVGFGEIAFEGVSAAAPEPSTLMLAAFGLVGLVARRRRRRR